jgi:hypothetical protein
MGFIYNLNEMEYLMFQPTDRGFELFSGCTTSLYKEKIASYRFGKWYWEGFNERKLFWFLFILYKKEFGRAIKAYNRTLKEKPLTWEFNCVYRRIQLKIVKYVRKKRSN